MSSRHQELAKVKKFMFRFEKSDDDIATLTIFSFALSFLAYAIIVTY